MSSRCTSSPVGEKNTTSLWACVAENSPLKNFPKRGPKKQLWTINTEIDMVEPNIIQGSWFITEKKAVLELADTSSCVKIASAMPCCKIVV